MTLLFGTAGVPLSSKDRSSEGGIRRIRELRLGALEIEFVHGVKMGESKALNVGTTAVEQGIALSCHGPYWINLNSREEEKVQASKERLIHTARIGNIIGLKSVIFHPAFYHGEDSDEVLKKVIIELKEVREALNKEGITLILRPETTGKPTQFGNLEESILMSQLIPGVLPCIDISHLHARTNGRVNTYDEFCSVLNQTAEALGDKWVKDAHFHLSGIEYGLKGEKRHVVLEESDFNYKDFLKALKTFGIEGLVICESPNLEEDALILQDYYQQLPE